MLADLPGSEEQVPFVGLHQTWGWSSSGHDDYEGEVAYWNWASKPAQGQQACGVVGPTGQWAARNCNNKLNFICFSGKIPTRVVRVYFVLEERQSSMYE